MAARGKSESRPALIGREMITVTNPVTGALIGEVPVMNRDEVRQAVERARAAQPAWNALGMSERAHLLKRWGDRLWANQKALMQTIRSETGKTDTGAFEEAAVLDNIITYYVHRAPELLAPQPRRTLFPFIHFAKVYHKPWGVVGFITPWNYPLLNAISDLVAALVAGNTIVLKPSEIAPFSSMYALDQMVEVGVPRDVVQAVTGAGATGAALVDYADMISFTGSTATGRKIAVRCAERLIPCSLELGGKDPLIVLNDADLDIAASGTLAGALENAGQACVSTERVYVEAGIYDGYIERLGHYAAQLVIGSHVGFDVHVGSMTNDRELLRTEQQIADAVQKGAKLIFGGKRRPDLGPRFIEPAILVDVDHTMDVMREETFGPVVPVMKVKNADEAIRLANDSEYGLSAAIFTRDLKRGEQLAQRIESGDVSINRTQWVFGTPSLPMGGVKNSGIGRRNGPEGLMRFVSTQSILVDNLLGARPYLTQLEPMATQIHLTLRFLRKFITFLRL